ncbi:MAG: hypothetical protein L0221_17995 [Chloroflexi bacterium]|nr:hypothetical protein [Chloroflexota bacterium]
MFPFHFAGVLRQAEDPREVRNRDHLLALRETGDAERRPVEAPRTPIQIQRLSFAGGSLSRSTDFGAACCA